MRNAYKVIATVAVIWIPLVAFWLFWLQDQDKHKSSNGFVVHGKNVITIRIYESSTGRWKVYYRDSVAVAIEDPSGNFGIGSAEADKLIRENKLWILHDTDDDKYHNSTKISKYFVVTDKQGNYRISDGDWISPINRTSLKKACEAARYLALTDPYESVSPELWEPVGCDTDSQVTDSLVSGYGFSATHSYGIQRK